jgi:hypothetical protein
LKTTHSGRERLSAQGLPTSLIEEARSDEPPAPAAPDYKEPTTIEDTTSFFDQDAF